MNFLTPASLRRIAIKSRKAPPEISGARHLGTLGKTLDIRVPKPPAKNTATTFNAKSLKPSFHKSLLYILCEI